VTWEEGRKKERRKEERKEGRRKEERKEGRKPTTCPKFKQDLIQTQIQNVTLTFTNRDYDNDIDDNMVL